MSCDSFSSLIRKFLTRRRLSQLWSPLTDDFASYNIPNSSDNSSSGHQNFPLGIKSNVFRKFIFLRCDLHPIPNFRTVKYWLLLQNLAINPLCLWPYFSAGLRAFRSLPEISKPIFLVPRNIFINSLSYLHLPNFLAPPNTFINSKTFQTLQIIINKIKYTNHNPSERNSLYIALHWDNVLIWIHWYVSL